MIPEVNEFQEIPLYMEKKVGNSGVVINTGPILEFNSYYESIKRMVQVFDVDIIVVLESERLYSKLNTDVSPKKVLKFLKISDSDPGDEKLRNERENNKFRTYFNGPADDILRSKITLSFSDVKICKISKSLATSDVLPAYIKPDTELRLSMVKPEKLKKMILGVSSLVKLAGEEPTLEELLDAPISFLIYVTNVDMEKSTIQILHPVSDDLIKTSKYWIYSEISCDL